MRFKLFAVLAAMVLIAAMVISVGADEAKKADKEHQYIGAKKCGLKPCHGNDGIFDSWAATAHATAYDKLTDEQKKDAELMKYYTTGTDKKGKLLEGVQCEACHGPGSDYKSKKIMQDREAAIANGLIIPTPEDCLSCHNENAPEALAKLAKDFDFEKMKETGIHVLPYSEEKK
jgi:hypothetical protein